MFDWGSSYVPTLLRGGSRLISGWRRRPRLYMGLFIWLTPSCIMGYMALRFLYTCGQFLRYPSPLRKVNLLCQLVALLCSVKLTFVCIIKLWQQLPALIWTVNLGLDLRGTEPQGSCLLMSSFGERFEQ